MSREEIERNRLNAALARGAYGGNPPSTQSVCPKCKSKHPDVRLATCQTKNCQQQECECDHDFHSPDTQTQERCETCGDTGYFRAEVGPSAATGPCPDCQPAPPDPQGQVETCPDCGATGSRHYADCPRRFVVAPSDKPVRYRNEHGDFWRCANCDSTLRVGETHTCFGLRVDAPYARLSILADALTERADAAEAQLDQAERRVEEAEEERNRWMNEAVRMREKVSGAAYRAILTELGVIEPGQPRFEEAHAAAALATASALCLAAQTRTEAAESLAASYREGVERFLNVWDEFDGPPLTPQDTFNAVAESVESLRSLLNPSSTSEGDA